MNEEKAIELLIKTADLLLKTASTRQEKERILKNLRSSLSSVRIYTTRGIVSDEKVSNLCDDMIRKGI